MKSMPESSNPFDEIFKRLTAEEFMEDPTRILSLMMDFGFDPRQVKILRMVMSEDMKEVKDFLRSPTGTGYEIAEGIAEYCLVSEDALKDILDGIRSSLNGDIGTEIIDDDEFGRCRISLDGIAKYSLDMSVLLWVKGNISEFRIPDSVTSIRDGAFRHCKLKEVHIPDSITWIGWHAFEDCRSLKEIHIPDSVRDIGEFAFSWCTSLKEVHIPDSVTMIESSAFDWCTSLKDVHIPDSVTKIGWDAFYGCKSLKEIHIPDSVTEIGQCAFSGCESLEEVYIPDSVTEIGLSAFDGCTSVHFIVDARNEFYCSESGALFDKEKKTLISGYALVRDGLCNIPESVTKIDGSIYGGAFSGCESLEEVYIPDFVTEIGEFAFSWCTSLKEVHIPDSVTEIGEHAFSYCNSVYFIVDPNNKHFYSKSGKLCRR